MTFYVWWWLMTSNDCARVAMLGVWLIGACAGFERGEATDAGAPGFDGAAGDGGDGVSFELDVYPVLEDRCLECHAQGAKAGQTDFVLTGDVALDQQTVANLSDAADPAGSKLLSRAGGNDHPMALPMTSADYDLVTRWMTGGMQP